MLAALIAILKPSLEASLLITLTIIFLKKIDREAKTQGIWAALLVALVAGYLVVNPLDFLGDREVFEVYLLTVATLAGVSFLPWAWGAVKKGRIQGSQVFLVGVLTPLLTIKTIEILLFPSQIFIMTTSVINSELLFKLGGALLGLVMPIVFAWALFRATRHLVLPRIFLVLTLVLVIFLVRQGITLLQLAFVLGYLPVTPWAVSIIAPLINYYYPAFFYVLTGVGCGVLALAYLSAPKPTGVVLEGLNPAQRRKVLAVLHGDRKWVKGGAMLLGGMVILLGANWATAQREVKLSPPIPLQASGKALQIPLETLADGKLHRFSYVTPGNTTMRFIAIKKGAGIYGVGLDACEICGTAGYYQKGKKVICKNCDVIINIPTIGFPGGCNPIPLASQVRGKNLVIQTADLEAREEVFKE